MTIRGALVNHATALIGAPPGPVERWLLKVTSTLAQRQTVLVHPTDDGAVLAVMKYPDWSAYLANNEIIDEAASMLALARPASPDLVEAETLHGRSALTDLLRVAEARAPSCPSAARARKSGRDSRAGG